MAKKVKKTEETKPDILPVVNKGGSPTAHELRYKNVGRKTKITDIVVKKIEDVIAMGGTVAMACHYAEITRTTYYNFLNANPEFIDRIEGLREELPLAALSNIANGIREEGDIPLSERYLARVMPNDYGNGSKPIRKYIQD